MGEVFLFYQCWFYGLVSMLWTHDPILSISTHFTVLFMTKWPAIYSHLLDDKIAQINVHIKSIICFMSGIILAFALIKQFNCKALVNTDPFIVKRKKNSEYEYFVRRLNFANGLFNILSVFLFSLAYYFLFGYYSTVFGNTQSIILGFLLLAFYITINAVSSLYKKTNSVENDDVYHLSNMCLLLSSNCILELIDCVINHTFTSFLISFFVINVLFYPLFYQLKMKRSKYDENVFRIFSILVVVHLLFHIMYMLIIQIYEETNKSQIDNAVFKLTIYLPSLLSISILAISLFTPLIL